MSDAIFEGGVICKCYKNSDLCLRRYYDTTRGKNYYIY